MQCEELLAGQGEGGAGGVSDGDGVTFGGDGDEWKEKRTLRFYLAGPMRGIEQFNFPTFLEAAEALREFGHEVFNPAERDLAHGFNPETDEPTPEFIQQAMEEDIREVLDAEAIALLPGWRHSTGAALECEAARQTGKELFELQKVMVDHPETEEKKLEWCLFPLKQSAPLSVLGEAEKLVGGDRQKEYGHPYADFKRSAGMISEWLGYPHDWDEFYTEGAPVLNRPLRPDEFAGIMELCKMSRKRQSPWKRDHYVDGAGYNSCAWDTILVMLETGEAW